MKALKSWLFFVLLCVSSVMAAFWLREGTDATVFAALDSMAKDLRHWLAERAEVIGHHAELYKLWDNTSRAASTGMHFTRETFQRTLSALDHTSGDSAVCGRPPTTSRDEINAHKIYKWVDADGQTHLSDKAPDGRIATVVDLGTTKQDFTYEIIPDDVSLPIAFQGQLAAGSKRMYDTWHFFLGEENLRQSRIQLLLMGDPDRFDAYYAANSGVNRKVGGFYSMSKNQAVVKYNPKHPTQNLGTSLHEISHLITAAHLGPTPPWLTEGLAEYFETMQVQGQAGIIYPNHNHIKLLRTAQLPRLTDYFSIKRSDWYDENRDRNYAIAWSLVNFLMGGAPGTYALQEAISQSQKNFCKPFSVSVALDEAYPGGIHQLEVDWRKWLTSGDFKPHQT